MIEDIKLTNEQVTQYVNEICEQVSNWKELQPDVIVGITRGGLVPAVMLSHKLNKPMRTLQWQTRDGLYKEHSGEIMQDILDGKIVYFIDDINDTGETFQQIKKFYTGGVYISLVQRKSSQFEVDFCPRTFDGENWIVFPWE